MSTDTATIDCHVELEGRVAIVTGASSGLGARFAQVLHASGASVVVAARRIDRLRSLAETLGSDRVVAIECDVAREDDCERTVAAAVETFGRLDILVNNAGIGTPMPAEVEPLDHWRRVVDVNLTGLFAMTQHAARQMLLQGTGSIVNVASILGLVASAPIKQASYAATKGAVVNLTRELACQWARKGVRVNAIAPGWFLTEMTGEMLDEQGSRAFVERNCPMGRAGAVDELDGVLLFLAGQASTYVTGVTIPVDGGWTAR